jgi:hypothetical protein
MAYVYLIMIETTIMAKITSGVAHFKITSVTQVRSCVASGGFLRYYSRSCADQASIRPKWNGCHGISASFLCTVTVG